MRIRRTADAVFEGDKEIVVTVKMLRDIDTWEGTDYTRAEREAFGESVATVAEIISEVLDWDTDSQGLFAMRNGFKRVLEEVRKAKG